MNVLKLNGLCSINWPFSFIILKPCTSATFSLKNFNNFYQMIDSGKSLSRRSLLIEDCTSSQNLLWFHDDQTLSERLFDSKASNVFRWRINSNGSIDGGRFCKRFLLVEFNSTSDFRYATKCKMQYF